MASRPTRPQWEKTRLPTLPESQLFLRFFPQHSALSPHCPDWRGREGRKPCLGRNKRKRCSQFSSWQRSLLDKTKRSPPPSPIVVSLDPWWICWGPSFAKPPLPPPPSPPPPPPSTWQKPMRLPVPSFPGPFYLSQAFAQPVVLAELGERITRPPVVRQQLSLLATIVRWTGPWRGQGERALLKDTA